LSILIFGFAFLIFLIMPEFVFAEHLVNNSEGGVGFSISDNTNTKFNITINNTCSGQEANITSINVTLPSTASCVFVTGTNCSSVGSSTTTNSDSFTNNSNVLSWTNTTGYVLNGTEYKFFWFNLTCYNTGNYNITVITTNLTGNYESNLTLEINDTASFDGNLTSPTTGTLFKSNSTTLNYTTDTGISVNCSVYVWYSNGTAKNSPSSVNNPTGGNGSLSISYDDNIFYWDVYCVNAYDVNDDLWLNVTEDSTSSSTSGILNFTIATHEFYGYTMNASNKSQSMNNTNVTFTIYSDMFGDNVFKKYTTNTNSNGWYNITNISFPSTYLFDINLVKYNETTSNNADYVGPSIPKFQRNQLTGEGEERGECLQNVSFYLKKGATLNISAHNGSGIWGSSTFSFYQVKDKSLGFPIVEGFTSEGAQGVNNFTANIPADRNYTVMIYPDEGMPVSLDVNSDNLSGGYFSYTFNISETNNRLTGYLNTSSGDVNFSSVHILIYLLEPGRMIFLGEHASALFNMSGDDSYNKASGFYNISVPGTPETTNAIIMPVAYNKSNGTVRDGNYYGGFESVELNMTGPPEKNFTLVKFKSDHDNPDSLNYWGNASGNISVPKVVFSVFNSENQSVDSLHVEIQLDYSVLNMTNFTLMIDGSASVDVAAPLLDGVGIKKMNIFSQSGGAPMKKKFTNSSLPGVGNGSSVNLTLRQAMEMRDPDGDSLGEIYIDMNFKYKQALKKFLKISNKNDEDSFEEVVKGTYWEEDADGDSYPKTECYTIPIKYGDEKEKLRSEMKKYENKLFLIKKLSDEGTGWGKLISKEVFIKECEDGYYRNQ